MLTFFAFTTKCISKTVPMAFIHCTGSRAGYFSVIIGKLLQNQVNGKQNISVIVPNKAKTAQLFKKICRGGD